MTIAELEVPETPNAPKVVLMADASPVAMSFTVSPDCTVYEAGCAVCEKTGPVAVIVTISPVVTVPDMVAAALPLLLVPTATVSVAPVLVDEV